MCVERLWTLIVGATLWLSPLSLCAQMGQAAEKTALSYAEKRQFDRLFLEAVVQREQGNDDAAYELLTRAAKLNPNAAEALYFLVEPTKMLFPDDTIRVRDLLERAVALDGGNVHYRETLAAYYADTRRWDDALRVYEQLVRQSAAPYDYLVEMLQIYYAKEDLKGAVRTLQKMELAEGKTEDISLEKFQLFLKMKDDKKAFAEIDALIKENPNDLRYQISKGQIYLQRDKPEKAYEIFQAALRQDSTNVYAQQAMVGYYAIVGKDSLYHAALRQFISNPDLAYERRVSLMQTVGKAYVSGGVDSLYMLPLFEAAMTMPQEDNSIAALYTEYLLFKALPKDTVIARMERIVKVVPEYSQARLYLLQHMLQTADFTRAIEVCDDGILYEPTRPVYYYYRALCKNSQDDTPSAIATLEKGREHLVGADVSPSFISDYYAAMGDFYHKVGCKEEAYVAYDSCLLYEGANLAALNNYAYFLYLDERQMDKAEVMSKKTIEADPQNATFLDTYARILFYRKRYAEAKIYMEEAIKNIDPSEEGSGVIWEFAGDVYAVTGDIDGAVRYWEEAVRQGEDSPVLQKKIKNRKYYKP